MAFKRNGAHGKATIMAIALAAAVSNLWIAGSSGGVAPALAISVVGNHLVNAQGQTIRLLGVNESSSEYDCLDGTGYSDLSRSPAEDLSQSSDIAAWGADAVRIPLNEDCWLGINGQPTYGTKTGYQSNIEGLVAALNGRGIYAILDLHWSGPGSVVADGQRPMPDDHAVAFWNSVASAFKGDLGVVFDAFNEPYSPAATADGSKDSVSWACWRNGGCIVPSALGSSRANDSEVYTAVGMQALVNAIRASGATQPIMLSGLNFANDLSGWLANEPTDPQHQLIAAFHNYYGETCDSLSCWNSTVAPVAATVPVVTSEFDEGYDCQDSPDGSYVPFDNTYMEWADNHDVSYLAWGWTIPGTPDPTTTPCGDLANDGSEIHRLLGTVGQALAPDGTNLKAHLQSLAGDAAYDLVASDGGVFTFGDAHFYGSASLLKLTKPVVDIAATPDGKGYWLAASDGGIFAFGDAHFYGSAGLLKLTKPVVAMAETPDGKGYWLAASDGGVFTFGDAHFYGSAGSLRLTKPIVGMAATPDGGGYWLVASDGGIFSFGDAAFYGSTGKLKLTKPIVGMSATPDGDGYWLAASDGGVFSFGDAAFYGAVGSVRLHRPVVGLTSTFLSGGYWLVASDGGIFAEGEAEYLGSTGGLSLKSPIVGIAMIH